MKKLFLIFIIGLISNSFIFSQSVYVDKALKFSTNNYGGTARFVGMGGAFGALGGDFSSIAINPAGLGVYRSSEFVFSPGMTYNLNKSTYLNNTIEESKYRGNVNNAGLVVSYDLENSDTRWVNFNFGVGFNRINDLNDNIHFQGVNNSTRMQSFVEMANATTTNPEELDGMYEYLLWESFVIDLDTIANEFYSEIVDERLNDPANFEINQRKILETEGSVSEVNFAFGGNYAHKLYIGASLGITRLRYSEYSSHYESETSAYPIPFINSFEFREHSKTEGTGFAFKFGAIYKPIEFIRIGASLHLPTFYNLNQEFYNEASGDFENINPEGSRSPIRKYEYQLTTPLRAVFSTGFQIGKFALIDVDYEFADYSTIKLDDEFNETYGIIQDNRDIETYYSETHNLRIGGEFRYGPLYLRAGGRYSTSPYEDLPGAVNADYTTMSYSGGLGYRENNFFVDFAFAQTTLNYKMYAYVHDTNNAIANIDNKMNNFILTFGVKF